MHAGMRLGVLCKLRAVHGTPEGNPAFATVRPMMRRMTGFGLRYKEFSLELKMKTNLDYEVVQGGPIVAKRMQRVMLIWGVVGSKCPALQALSALKLSCTVAMPIVGPKASCCSWHACPTVPPACPSVADADASTQPLHSPDSPYSPCSLRQTPARVARA